MIEKIKILLGDSASNYSSPQIELAYELSLLEVEEYCNRKADATLQSIAMQIAVIKLNRTNTEGLASQSMNGVNESYIDGYPAEIVTILNRKRKLKLL